MNPQTKEGRTGSSIWAFAWCFLVVVTTGRSAEAVGSYRVTDLGILPGGLFSRATDINSSGQVVGHSGTASAFAHPFLWESSAGMQDLGDLPDGRGVSYAEGINSSGQVVGWSESSITTHAFLWTSSGGIQDLGDLPGGQDYSSANAINAAGQVVGVSSMAGPRLRPFLWTSTGGMQDLGTLPGGSGGEAHDINDIGQIVGSATLPGNPFSHAFFRDTTGGLQDLGTLPGGNSSVALAVNALGHAAGYSTAAGTTQFRAFFWSPDTGMQNLGILPGREDVSYYASDINGSNQVVGRIYPPGARGGGFIWTADAGMQNLNHLLDVSSVGWDIWEANGINDFGQIVGWGAPTPGSQGHAILLTPLPEPSTRGLLIAVGVVAVLRIRSKRWSMSSATLIASLRYLCLISAALLVGTADADIYQWEYVNPADPSLGKQQSAVLCPNGAGLIAGPGATWVNGPDLTKGYFIGADLSN